MLKYFDDGDDDDDDGRGIAFLVGGDSLCFILDSMTALQEIGHLPRVFGVTSHYVIHLPRFWRRSLPHRARPAAGVFVED